MQPWKNENIILIWFCIGLLLIIILSIGFVFLLKVNHKKHLDNENKIKTLQQQYIQKLQHSSIEIQEKEKQRIGSDLHDSVMNALHVLFLKSQVAPREDKLAHTIEETMELTRRISNGLNPPLLEYASLENLTRDLFQQWSAFYSIQNQYSKSAQRDLNLEQKKHILRIIQELMSNIHKHAQATHIDFQLRLSTHYVAFKMTDNGIGFGSKAKNKGIGIQNIQTRTEIIGATFKYKKQLEPGVTFLFLLKTY